jgi:hypothetical protein
MFISTYREYIYEHEMLFYPWFWYSHIIICVQYYSYTNFSYSDTPNKYLSDLLKDLEESLESNEIRLKIERDD